MSTDHEHGPHHAPDGAAPAADVTRLAVTATVHCLTGCAIGEVLGMVIGTALELHNAATVALSVVLAFVFGYALTIRGVRKAGVTLAAALPLAFASDTISIAVMEIVDNLLMLVIPGAMDAGLGAPRFWGSLAVSLGVAFVAAVPVNRALLQRGRGHAVVHQLHTGHGGHH